MHGRPREFKHKLKDPKAAEAYAKKVEAIKAGTTLVLDCRAKQRYDPPALRAAEKLLKVVPEIYTLWNYRREALEPLLSSSPSSPGVDGEARQTAVAAELALTAAALMENPKSYSTWHHRRWLVEVAGCDLGQELGLVTRALQLDGRNFHAWRHRQWVVGRLGVPPQEELAYSSTLIAADFSNYSAWHYRTVLLPLVYGGGAAGGVQTGAAVTFEELMKGTPPPPAAPAAPAAPSGSCASTGPQQQQQPGGFKGTAVQAGVLPPHVLDQEYELVHQAFATDAGDQSPWLYYRWLLGNTLGALGAAASQPPAAAAGARQQVLQVLSREVDRFQSDHLAQDSAAKWPLLMVAQLKQAQAALADTPEQQQQLRGEVAALYQQLVEVDPLRKGFYQDAAAGRAAVVVRGLGQQDVLVAEPAAATAAAAAAAAGEAGV